MKTRKPTRLDGYDYSQEGYYFVTACTKNAVEYFGEVINENILYSEIGRIVAKCWEDIHKHFGNVVLDEYIIMPNHVHGIIEINNSTVGAGLNKGVDCRDVIHDAQIDQRNNKGVINHARTDWMMMKKPLITLGKIIRYVKAQSSKLIHNCGYTDFQWHRNYYDHIIRSEHSLNKIREYILNNPAQWEHDRNNISKDNEWIKKEIQNALKA